MNTHLFILTGASRGMGLAMAEQLLAANHQLLCISRHLNAGLADLAVLRGCDLTQLTLDLSEPQPVADQLANWLQAGAPGTWHSATLINNAALIPAIAPLSACCAAKLMQTLRVGLEAPMLLTAAFLAATESLAIPRKVLNISSGLGRRPMASQSAYCAAKAGLDHFTRCLALEEGAKPHGAKVCSLAPGVVDTDMQMQLRSAQAASFPDRESFVQLKQQGLLTTPQQAAVQVLARLNRSDFGNQPVADVRES